MHPSTLRRHLRALAELDPDVATGIKLVGYPAPRVRAEGFETLLSIIVSQQISTEAAAAIMRRLREQLPEMTADALLALPVGALREVGFSNRKVEYASDLASAVMSGELPLERLRKLDDGEVIRYWALKGEGIALKSVLDVQDDINNQRLVTLLNGYMKNFNTSTSVSSADLNVVYISKKYQPKRIRLFLDFLIDNFGRLTDKSIN